MSMKAILVIEGTVFLSSNLCYRLIKGERLICVDNYTGRIQNVADL